MSARPPFKTALGISTGDIVTTSYGTGPYEVWEIHGPWRVDDRLGEMVIYEYPEPMISLSLIYPGEDRQRDWMGIGYITRIDGRWVAGARDELFVTPGNRLRQQSLFDAPTVAEDVPGYAYQDGVNYDIPVGQVWHCGYCGVDRNAERTEKWVGPRCPTCPTHPPMGAILILPAMLAYPDDIGWSFSLSMAWRNAPRVGIEVSS